MSLSSSVQADGRIATVVQIVLKMDDFTIETSKGRYTLEEALARDVDMLPALSGLQKTIAYQHELESCRPRLEKIIQRHLGIPQSDFVLSRPEKWIWGNFNICLPIYINGDHGTRLPRQALIRFPLPHNVGEAFSPGTVNEKLRCEAATYIWLQTECPTVPIPRLLGMGFPGLQSVIEPLYDFSEDPPADRRVTLVHSD